MTYEAATHQIAFVLPLYFLKAEITFIRNSMADESLSFPISSASQSRYVISTENLSKGYWRVQLNWSEGKSRYCSEKVIEIN